MTMQISWRRVDDNRAEFTVSESSNFYNGAEVSFGKTSDKGKRWRQNSQHEGLLYLCGSSSNSPVHSQGQIEVIVVQNYWNRVCLI
jgi:hypothetical protein